MNIIEYMQTHIKLNSMCCDVDSMSEVELIQAFSILPTPKVPYQKWLAKMAAILELDEQEQEQEEPPTKKIDPYERLKIEGQRLFEAGIIHIGPSKKQTT